MSSYLTPALYSNNGLENQWVNIVWNTHDIICGCNDCFKHLFEILKRKGSLPCLPSTTEDAGTEDRNGDGAADAGLEDGELDRLFAEDSPDEQG